MHSIEALDLFSASLQPGTRVLDVGAGTGAHAASLRQRGFEVTTVDNVTNLDADHIPHDYLNVALGFSKAIWCSHVLEHQRNVGKFLEKIFGDLEPGGLLAITVPPMREKVVGGHINQFNKGTLVYQLVLAGFDCREAAVKEYDYNISVLVRKPEKIISAVTRAKDEREEIEYLANKFPWPNMRRGVLASQLPTINWRTR